MIAAVIRSALVDEALQSGLRARLDQMKQRLVGFEEHGAKKRQLAPLRHPVPGGRVGRAHSLSLLDSERGRGERSEWRRICLGHWRETMATEDHPGREIEESVVGLALSSRPSARCELSNELRKRGLLVSATSVRCLWAASRSRNHDQAEQGALHESALAGLALHGRKRRLQCSPNSLWPSSAP